MHFFFAARLEINAEANNISWVSLSLVWKTDLDEATFSIDVDRFDGKQFSPAHGYEVQPMYYNNDTDQMVQNFDKLDSCTMYIFTVRASDMYGGLIGYGNPVRVFTFDNQDGEFFCVY